MDFFWATQFPIPMSQIALLLGLSTLALFFGRLKVALLINYCFTVYWGYISNFDLVKEHGEKSSLFLFSYFGFGVVVIVMALIGFLFYQD